MWESSLNSQLYGSMNGFGHRMRKWLMLTLDDLGNIAARQRPSLVEDAYRALKDAIRENVFPPGYQGSEQEMAMRLGMSRTPVHEAIIRLQEDGLVRVLSKRG